MYSWIALFISVVYFFVNYPPTTRIYTYCRPLSLHVALPIPRNRRTPGARYFGPYPKIWAVRDTIELMVRAFPIRTCSDSSYKRAMQTGRPCFPGQIGRCGGPCSGRVTIEEHREIVDDFVAFMAHPDRAVVTLLQREMRDAAAHFEYERAAVIRDRLQAL